MVHTVPFDISDSDWVELPFSLSKHEPKALLTLKSGGDMRMTHQKRRMDFFTKIGVDPSRVSSLRQVHSRRVLKPQREGTIKEGDGMITLDPDLVLSVTVADCLPIFLYDERSGARGLLHSGWKGTGIVSQAVARMRLEWNCRAENLRALLGPCIASTCYQVDETRYRKYREEFGEEAVNTRDGGFYLDMRGANLGLLNRLGVRRISVVQQCTHCHPRLGSYRRDGADGYGLMLAVLGNF